MKRNLLLLLLFSISLSSFSQNTTKIIYSNVGLEQRPQCNIFNISGPDSIGGKDHIPGAGGALGTNKSVGLVSYLALSNIEYATAYMINYPFKKDTTYEIIVNAYVRSSNSIAKPRIQLSAQQNIPDPNITLPMSCGPVSESHFYPFETNIISDQFITATAASYPSTFKPIQDASYLGILSRYSSYLAIVDTVFINSITIVEKAYPIYKLDSKQVKYSCGSTNPTTINLTKTDGDDNGTLQFQWNLGSNNGWKYNNTSAPSTIITTTPTITLSPSGTQTPSNITIKEFYNGIQVDTFLASVVTTNPYYSIIGESQICSNETYSVDSLLPGSSVTWSTTSPNIATLVPSGDQVTVSKLVDGVTSLRAIITNACGIKDTVVRNNINVGLPNPTFIPYGSVCNGNPFQLSANPVYGDIGHSWIAHTTNGDISLSENGFWTVEVDPGTLYVQLTVTTKCGSATKKQIIRYNNCGISYFKISPNPSSSFINITSLLNAKNNSLNHIKYYKIYSESGGLIKSVNSLGTSNSSVDISGLKTGVYYIELTTDKGVEKHKFLKK